MQHGTHTCPNGPPVYSSYTRIEERSISTNLSDDATADAASDGCPDKHRGPALVRAGDFCIDATEVTNQDYQAFQIGRASCRERV